VFTGGRILAANRAASARVADAGQRRRATEGDLTAELVRRYYGVRLAARVRQVRRQVLDGLLEHEREATRMQQEGLIARAEQLHAAVARAEAERALQGAACDESIARTGLADLLAEDGPLEPASPLFVPERVESLAVFAATAQRTSPLLGQAAAQRALAHQGLRAEQGAWLPEIYLFGVKELVPEDLTLLDPKWAVGVGARLPLFDGFARENRVRAARATEQRVAHLEQGARRGVGTLVEKRWQELLKACEQAVALRAARDLVEENLRVREHSFREGLATSLEVVDAELARARVRVEQLAAAYGCDVALAELLAASGQPERFESYRSQAGEEVEP
jgi:outer membrane protein TolC